MEWSRERTQTQTPALTEGEQFIQGVWQNGTKIRKANFRKNINWEICNNTTTDRRRNTEHNTQETRTIKIKQEVARTPKPRQTGL